MQIEAKVLLDSVNPFNDIRLTTMELSYPRFVHAEFMTHRVFSRNASSSRAIPISKQIDLIEHRPVVPVEWGQNKPGMQAGEPISRMNQTIAEDTWASAMNDAIRHARKLKDLGVHKQIVNRLLEPFAHIRVIVTATEWENFFRLRISELAQPEIRRLAETMLASMNASEPVTLSEDDIHAPYVTSDEKDLDHPTQMMLSAARCARVSYLNHDGLPPDISKDMALAHRLFTDKHASVFEHQATPMTGRWFVKNFRGWEQHRHTLGL